MSVMPRVELDRRVIADALDLPERFELLRIDASCFTPDPRRAADVVERWKGLLGREADAGIDDLLDHHGFSMEEFASAVGSIEGEVLERHAGMPWVEACEEVLAWDGSRDEHGIPTAGYLSTGEEEQIPFEHALVPWVDVATMRLRSRRPRLDEELSESLLREEQRGLVEGLATFARDCNVTDFSRARLGAYDANDMAMGMFMKEPPREVYRNTVRSMTDPRGMAEWMGRYPALARLLAVRVEAWARAVGEMLERLELDGDLIARHFNQGAPLESLKKASFGRGDSHNGGRTVAMLEFESGLKLVYKPRSLSIDVASESLFGTINPLLEEQCRIRVPKALDRGLYGWVEHIDSEPCADEDDLRLFHLRMGVLLGVIHLMQGNDFHLENVIARGAMPVPIDLETISVPSGTIVDEDGEMEDLIDPARTIVSNSVLGTLLLPSAMAMGKHMDLRQLGALRIEVPNAVNQAALRKLAMVNTDFQRWVASKADSTERPNSEPWIEGGERNDAMRYLDETRRGYRIFYEAVQGGRTVVGDAFSVLDDAWVRVLNRATNVYYRLILESCGSSHMSSGVDRWIHLRRLGLSVESEPDENVRKMLLHLIDAEGESLFDGDVAYFSARGAGMQYATTDPASGEHRMLEGVDLGRSARRRAEEQLERMSESDLEIQLRLQGEAYTSTSISLSRTMHGSTLEVPEDAEADAEVDEQSLRERVIAGLEILDDQRFINEGIANWIGLEIDLNREVITPTSLNSDMYSGRGGIALLFEKAYRVLGDSRWLEVARSSIELELAVSRRHKQAPLHLNSPDGMGVRGGLLAALWAIGRHEGMGDCRDLARVMVADLDQRLIDKDEGYDVIAGSAGHILMLIGLDEEERIPGLNPVIEAMADHLVRGAIDDDGPGWALQKGGRGICGFGHGRSGIGLALVAAGRAVGREDLVEFGLAAFHAEHRCRGDHPDEGWPDLRSVKQGSREKLYYGSTLWCNGAEGIALAYASALKIVDDPIVREDLDVAVHMTNQVHRSGRHHICCGSSGRALALASLRRLVPEADIVDPMRQVAMMARAIDTIDTKGEFGLHGPGLFQGHAGAVWTGLSMLDEHDSDLLLLRI